MNRVTPAPSYLFSGVDPLSEDDGPVGAVPQLLECDVAVHHFKAGCGLTEEEEERDSNNVKANNIRHPRSHSEKEGITHLERKRHEQTKHFGSSIGINKSLPKFFE